jgi:ACR3 family arsenite efflux pump ArsB
MVALNSLTMLVLYGILGGFLLGVGRLPVPWQALQNKTRRCLRRVKSGEKI